MKSEPSVCFVTPEIEESTPGVLPNESSRWLLYAAHALGAHVCNFYDLEQGRCLDHDVYVLEREVWRFPWHRRGHKRILAWLDDAYHLLPELAGNHKYWQKLLPDFKRNLARCDGIVAPNPLLLSDYVSDTQEAHLIPNYHDFPIIEPQGRLPYQGWGGSANHWLSWRNTGLYRNMPASDLTPAIMGQNQVYEMVRRYYPNTVARPLMKHDDYLREIGTWMLYVIPVDGEYDRRRSWIKALEAAYVGTEWWAVGDAQDIYRNVPRSSESQSEPMRWAEQQRITYHLEEWKGALWG